MSSENYQDSGHGHDWDLLIISHYECVSYPPRESLFKTPLPYEVVSQMRIKGFENSKFRSFV